MKTYTVEIAHTITVKVVIDETIVNKETLDAITDHFDEDLFELDSNVLQSHYAGELTEAEKGYMNYARHAAMHKIGLESEFITLDKGHTSATIQWDDFEFDIAEE